MTTIDRGTLRELRQQLEHLSAAVDAIQHQWWAHRLAVAQIEPGQLPDSLLREEVTRFVKGSGMKLFGRVRTVEPAGDAMIITAIISAGRDVVAKLRDAFGRVISGQLSEMHRRGNAGRVLRADTDNDGLIVVKALVTDRVAADKIRERVYAGLSLDCDVADGEIVEVSLVDRPFEKVGGDRVIAKLYTREDPLMSKRLKAVKRAQKALAGLRKIEAQQASSEPPRKAASPPTLPESSQRVIAELDEARKALDTPGGDRVGKEARMSRAIQAAQFELVKTAPRIVPAWAVR